MEVNYGYDEYHPDMSLGMPEDLLRAQQYNISADLRCANSNNERPDWRHRGVDDPWCENPKFHDPSMQNRVEYSMLTRPGCGPKNPNVINYYAGGKGANGANSSKNGGNNGGNTGSNTGEGFAAGKEGCAVNPFEGMDVNTLLIVIMFAFIIYIIMGCSATIKDLKKQIKKLQKQAAE